jgi:hypothetical protein
LQITWTDRGDGDTSVDEDDEDAPDGDGETGANDELGGAEDGRATHIRALGEMEACLASALGWTCLVHSHYCAQRANTNTAEDIAN